MIKDRQKRIIMDPDPICPEGWIGIRSISDRIRNLLNLIQWGVSWSYPPPLPAQVFSQVLWKYHYDFNFLDLVSISL